MEGAVHNGTRAMLEALAAGDLPRPTREFSDANNDIVLYAVHMVELYGGAETPAALHDFSYAVGVVMGTSLAIYGNSEMHRGGDE